MELFWVLELEQEREAKRRGQRRATAGTSGEEMVC
jgi:hypothetical protein